MRKKLSLIAFDIDAKRFEAAIKKVIKQVALIVVHVRARLFQRQLVAFDNLLLFTNNYSK